jgi:hypothetical protein
MKLTKWALLAITSATLVATGCGEHRPPSPPPTQQVATTTAQPAPPPAAPDPEPQDPWTYYNDAKWSDTYNGLDFVVEKVAVSDTMPKLPDDQTTADTSSVVGVKFKMVNSTDKPFSFYPDQAKLVTSTGEQIDMPDLWNTTHLGGEIDGGVTKEGDIVWLLQRGHAEDIQWITMSFTGYTGVFGQGPTGAPKHYTVKLTLK